MNTKVLSVSDVNRYIKTLLETNSLLKNLLIQGELSNVRRSAAGHLYFSLKDEGSKLDCVMFKNAARNLKITPKEGQKVTVRGSLGVYLPSGQYQVTIRSMEARGLGDLYQTYLMLKDELESKGYFDKGHKKALPEIIGRVGVVTSPTGAALQDMITIIKRRNPLMDIVVFPSLVQGPEAPKTLIEGLKTFNALKNVDVIVLSRGGGSIEDLWAFNDEKLAEAIYQSELPVISAVGHEIDFTIADFVADLRAPTPSGAAEIIAEDHLMMLEYLRDLKGRLETEVLKKIQENKKAVENLKKHLFRYRPEVKIQDFRLKIDEIEKHLTRNIRRNLLSNRQAVEQYRLRIEAMNPENILAKGYIVVKDEKGMIVSSIKKIKNGQRLNMKFKDGTVEVIVDKIEENK